MKTIKQVADSPYFWFLVCVLSMGAAIAAGVIKSALR